MNLESASQVEFFPVNKINKLILLTIDLNLFQFTIDYIYSCSYVTLYITIIAVMKDFKI